MPRAGRSNAFNIARSASNVASRPCGRRVDEGVSSTPAARRKRRLRASGGRRGQLAPRREELGERGREAGGPRGRRAGGGSTKPSCACVLRPRSPSSACPTRPNVGRESESLSIGGVTSSCPPPPSLEGKFGGVRSTPTRLCGHRAPEKPCLRQAASASSLFLPALSLSLLERVSDALLRPIRTRGSRC